MVKQTKNAQEALVQKDSWIWVTFQKEGIHRYPRAGLDENLATGDRDDVSFLSYPHRHIFHFTVYVQVYHNDRDIEFIQFKRALERSFEEQILQVDYKSCEMIAEDVIEWIENHYGRRGIVVDVSEDKENGAQVRSYPVS